MSNPTGVAASIVHSLVPLPFIASVLSLAAGAALVQCSSNGTTTDESAETVTEVTLPSIRPQNFGAQVAFVRDCDADGVPDIAISAPTASFGRCITRPATPESLTMPQP